MKKRRLIFLLSFLLFPTLSAAHAVVMQASLPISPRPAHKSSDIVLRFNAAIEVSLAQFFLVKAHDEQEKLPIQAGDQAGEIKISLPALEAGKYALKFKIFATDSHLTEDVLYFWVK